MSWLLNLYETYEANVGAVGIIEKKHNDQEYTLLPVSHTTQNAHIEVNVTEDGRFHSATVVDKADANTLIPCTEDSASRAGAKIAPYPLHDKISYSAGDFLAYGGEIKKENPFTYYITQLREWAESPYAVDKVRSIYRYLSQGRLIQDLVEHQVLFTDEHNRLLDKWDKPENKPSIFGVMVGGPESLFVRFNVYSPDKLLTPVWKDPEMYDSFIRYYSRKLGDEDQCYVIGSMRPSTDKHANKIRNPADKAKLISANDDSGFTYRGRFTRSQNAASISYEASQKAHNALKWLINRQAKIIDQRVFLIWGNDDLNIVDPMDDLSALVGSVPDSTPSRQTFTNKEFAAEYAKALAGYRNRLGAPSQANVNIMVLDSATTGRMAVLYYRNMDKELYLNRLVDWHSTCVWLHRYLRNADGQWVEYFGAPATKDIAFAAYGPRAGEKVVKGLMERMLPCIVDQAPIPQDIIRSAYYRASNPVGMERWEWEKTLSIACALINRKERFRVALDHSNNDRDYLFGRLLAVADVLERFALGREEERATNAIRYMNSFARHPARTWATIQAALQPYQARLGIKATYWTKIIDEIGSRISADQFNNRPLSGVYLLGYYSQRHELYQKKGSRDEETEVESQS